MGMVTVTVAFDRVGEFLDLCTDTIVRVQQDDAHRVCRFVLHVPEMASCEAPVIVHTADDSQTAWLVPVVPSIPDPILAAKPDELLNRREVP